MSAADAELAAAPPGSRLTARWRATPAHVRSLVGGLLLVGIGVVLRRPDAVVFGAPLVAVALWGTVTRPSVSPVVHAGPRHPLLREGQSTSWVATVAPGPGVEEVGLSLLRTPFTRYTPASRAMSAAGLATAPTLLTLDIVCRSMRWGSRSLGPATLAVSAPFGAFTWEPEPVVPDPLPTVPLPDSFTARVPVPRPDGLVGQNRSHHLGDGSELADIRAFRFGDRLRRVHWPVSIRTGQLHVTSTYADQDSEILLLVDAMHDLGRSEGIDGESSSLDNSVRAAGAIAEHYLRTGDRVGLLVLGARELPRISAAAGNNHLRRLLDVLARVQVADSTVSDEKRLRRQLHHQVAAGTLVLVLTPAISAQVLAHAVSLSRRGIAVIAVDTLPTDLARADVPTDRLTQLTTSTEDSPEQARLAWRLRLLEREHEMLRARTAGVPIVPWGGPGTLDLVLRDLGRRSRAPRVRSR